MILGASPEAFVWRVPSRRRHDHKKTMLCRFHTPTNNGNDGAFPSKKPKQASGCQTPSRINSIMLNIKKSMSLVAIVMALQIGSAHTPVCAGEAASTTVLHTVAFGACAAQTKPQTIWDAIVATDPDLFLFIGDNIYGDTEDPSVLKRKYAQLAAKPGYQNLLKTCPLLSTWDDHDYGKNDGGEEYVMREESAEIFLDFFNVPQDSPRRSRAGIYGAQTFGEAGKRVQVILLDTRYFRSSPMVKNTISKQEKRKKNLVGWYVPTTNTDTTILGAEQWAWLEKQLEEDADVRIIASSIQVVSQEKGMECWGNFPHERKRLFDLIQTTKANGVVFISGDVHFSEISVDTTGPYPLYDFTSSGMTHSGKAWSRAVNSLRVGNAYSGLNFGLISMDWANQSLTLESKSAEGETVIQNDLLLSDLMVK